MTNRIIYYLPVLAIILLLMGLNPVYAMIKPYDSGFNHGCSDSHIENANDRYINQPGKGPSYHTEQFMEGYKDGFKECGLDNGVLIDSSTTTTTNQAANQEAFTTQNGSCPSMILIGNCNIGQSSSNHFANANENDGN